MTATGAAVKAPLAGTVVELAVPEGASVRAGATLCYIEAMKMEHAVTAPTAGRVGTWKVAVGDLVEVQQMLLEIEHLATKTQGQTQETLLSAPVAKSAPDGQPDAWLAWQKAAARHADAARPNAVAKRVAQGGRTARANVADLVGLSEDRLNSDPQRFIEYGALAFAAQTQRRPIEELRAQTPADGIITGIGRVNTPALANGTPCQTAILAYDATVLAGTQGFRNHQKTDRLLQLAAEQRLPVVLFAEGGGGRPGDVDMPVVAGLHVGTFGALARLHGRVPVIAVVHGRCFAGNAALAGMADVIIATESSNIGLGGPAMVEGGGLGRFSPEEIGPSHVQAAIGGVDLLATDEADATALAKQVLAYFQGNLASWRPPDLAAQQALRHLVPEHRHRSFAALDALRGITDIDSSLELGATYGQAIHTVLARIEGKAVGVVLSNSLHLGGAMDAAACRKLSRFLNLLQQRRLPLLSLIDTPGFMVGPDAEAQGTVRASGELFWAAAAIDTRVAAIVMKRGFGLGAMALAAGGFHRPGCMAAWPGAEFGAMGLEGAVKLGFRKELAAVADDMARQSLFDRLLSEQIAAGSAIRMAETLEIDTILDPAQTRGWATAVLWDRGQCERDAAELC